MLNKKEILLLKVLSDNAVNFSCLMTLDCIVAFASNLKILNDKNVKEVLLSLQSKDFLEYVITEKDSEKLYGITLLKKGKNYKLEQKKETAIIKRKVFLAVLGGVISFIVGRILIAIFK